MKNTIVPNIISIFLLIVLVISYILFGKPIWFLAVFFIWVVFTGVLNYKILVKDNDKVANLKRSDSHHLFGKEIMILEKATKSVEFYRPIFEKYEKDSSLYETYETLSNMAYANIDRATKWIFHYDYISRPSTSYLNSIVKSSELVVKKLNELDELVLQMDNSADGIDMSFVDDMLLSLKEVLLEDE